MFVMYLVMIVPITFAVLRVVATLTAIVLYLYKGSHGWHLTKRLSGAARAGAVPDPAGQLAQLAELTRKVLADIASARSDASATGRWED